MATVTIHEAKTNLSKLIARALDGEDIVIANRTQPRVRLVPVEAKPQRVPGRWKGRFTIDDRFFEPLSEEELKAWGFLTRLLLDTHALLWWILDSSHLSDTVVATIRDSDNEVFVSAVSAIEIAIKFRAGKLPEAGELIGEFPTMIAEEGFGSLAITVEHGRQAGLMPIPHKDPFDRLLIAQAQIENAYLVSNETLFDQFGVLRLW